MVQSRNQQEILPNLQGQGGKEDRAKDMKCPECSCPDTYVGFSKIECANHRCKFYTPQILISSIEGKIKQFMTKYVGQKSTPEEINKLKTDVTNFITGLNIDAPANITLRWDAEIGASEPEGNIVFVTPKVSIVVFN